jgi:hypothetical protein
MMLPELGVFRPEMEEVECLGPGEVGVLGGADKGSRGCPRWAIR